MNEPRFDVLLFDLGGVLFDFRGFESLAAILADRPPLDAVRRRWIESDIVHAFERGEIGASEFSTRLVADWSLPLSPEAFLADFAAWARGPYPGALELLDELRGDYRLACLSNANELHTAGHRRHFEDRLDALFFSNEIGVTKPDPAIFGHIARALAVDPSRIAFFDDTGANVRAAADSGFSSHLTDGFAALVECLGQLGIAHRAGTVAR